MATTPVTESQPIAPSAFTQSKWRVRLFGGDMTYIRRGQGPPVVLLHGIPSSSYLWRDVIDPLSRYFDVVAPDLLGYGDSDKRVDADLSVEAQERYVIALMESLGIQRAHIVGHDIGGGIAQLIAADEPARVGKLVLIDSIMDDNWPIPEIARLHDPFWDQRMVSTDLRQGFGEGLQAGIVTPGRITAEMLDEWVRPFSDQAGRRGYLRAARALNNKDLLSRSNDIREIRVPTLILWGANDKFLERSWAEKLHQKLQNSVVQIIEPGGHFLPLDRPDALVPLLLQFLTQP
jgi:pimeloyl-ACP methyl ester carboxylesterase